jgi:hypothetical protein
MKSTRNRIICNREDNVTMQNNRTPTENAVNYEDQVIAIQDQYIIFSVFADQSIAQVIRGIEGLPEGECRVICRDASNSMRIIYESQKNDGWRRTGAIGKQNIYTYFAVIDTNKNNTPRWQIIQNEMEDLGINEIEVTVEPL